LYAELHDADRRKDEFLAMLGHELRNPLAAIVTALDMLEDGGLEPGVQRQLIAVARRQAEHQTRLVEDLLEVSRLMRGKIQIRRERIDLVAALRSLAAAHERAFAERRQTLAVHVPDEPVMALVDPTR